MMSVLILFAALLATTAGSASAAELRAIQRGTTTMVSGGRVFVGLGSVLRDSTKAFLVFTTTIAGSTQPGKCNVAGRIIGDDSLVFLRSDNGSGNLNTISWEVFEFTSGVTVQRGSLGPSATSTNVTLPNAVDLAKSFPIVTHYRGGTVFGADDALTATLTTSTNLKLDFGGTPNDSTYWQVITYNDCFVQQVATTLAAASTSTTGTIPVSVNTAKTMVISNFRSPSDINAYDAPRTELTNGTTLTYTRVGTTGAISIVAYVVQFVDSTQVTRATTNFASGTGTVDVTLSPAVDTSVTGVISPGHMNRTGSTSNTTGAFGYSFFTTQLTSTTNLRIIRGETSGQTSDFPYQLVTFSKNEYKERTYNTTINFNTTSTGANVSSDQSNFPVLVRLDANNFLFSQADVNGADIRFADPDGQPLKYQIERWDNAGKAAEIWVLVPVVSGNSTSDFIRMYWGNVSAMSASNGPAVFGTTNNYSAVLHLNEVGNTTGGGYSDATGTGRTGTGVAMTSATQVAGAVGLGQSLNGSTQWINVTGNFPTTTSARNMSAWGKLTNPTAQTILVTYGSGANLASYGAWNSAGSWIAGIGAAATTSELPAERTESGISSAWITTAPPAAFIWTESRWAARPRPLPPRRRASPSATVTRAATLGRESSTRWRFPPSPDRRTGSSSPMKTRSRGASCSPSRIRRFPPGPTPPKSM